MASVLKHRKIMNKELQKENTQLKERNQLLENAFIEMKKKLEELSILIGAKPKLDKQKQFYTSQPDDEL